MLRSPRLGSLAAALGPLLPGASLAEPKPPGLTLGRGGVSATLTVETDASAGKLADTVSIAPDLSAGATGDLTLSIVHSSFARTGFRGSAGSGICATEACEHTYDTAGAEGTYSLVRGPFALAANAGVHAASFDRGHYVAKLGAKARLRAGRLVVATLPSVFVAFTGRDDAMPNRDRLWLPLSVTVQLAGPLSLGLGTGFKAPLDDVARSYEIAAGVSLQYALSPRLGFGASWVHGKIAGGEAAIPDGQHGYDSRAIQVWAIATR